MGEFVSRCCRVAINVDPYGGRFCSKCWSFADYVEKPRDLIAWIFPAEQGPRPAGEPVFIRYGQKVEYLAPGSVKGRPDGWSWGGA